MTTNNNTNIVQEQQLVQPPAQPHRSSTSCDKHPEEVFSGFCPSCLCERLTELDINNNTNNNNNNGRKSTSSLAQLKSLFSGSNNNVVGSSTGNNGGNGNVGCRGRASVSSFLPELRRTKSFSGLGGFGGVSGAEPQRKSCDVRGRSTLWNLFSQDDHVRRETGGVLPEGDIVIETREEEEELVEEEEEIVAESGGGGVCEIVEEEEEGEGECSGGGEGEAGRGEIEEIVEEEEGSGVGAGVGVGEGGERMEVKTMKDHLEKDVNGGGGGGGKKVGGGGKDLKGSLWTAASVFSKKLKAWTTRGGNGNGNGKLKKESGCQTVEMRGKKWGKKKKKGYFRDTQSEIADYGFGRRSCDTDPRVSFDVGRYSVDAGRYSVDAGRYSVDAGRYSVDAGRCSVDAGRCSVDAGRYSVEAGRYSVDAGRYSVDAGRISFDDPSRCSFDEPRASWDGYLIGGRSYPNPRTMMIPPMVSVVEDVPPQVAAVRKDMQIPVEDQPRRSSVSINGDEGILPGGVAQTKDYYSDSSSRRRKSLDRSSSIRKTAAAVVAEMDDMKSGELRDLNLNSNSNSNSNSLRDECCSESFRDNDTVIGGVERKGSKKSSRRWRNIWGLIYRRGGGNSKDEDDDRYSSRLNGVERSFSESWQELRREGYGDPRVRGFNNRNVFRSNSSVSWRNSYNFGANGSFGSVKKGGVEAMNGNHSRKKKDDFVLERNRSAKYSPTHGTDNGMLRFYLTPLGSRRGKAKPTYSQSFARSVLRMY